MRTMINSAQTLWSQASIKAKICASIAVGGAIILVGHATLLSQLQGSVAKLNVRLQRANAQVQEIKKLEKDIEILQEKLGEGGTSPSANDVISAVELAGLIDRALVKCGVRVVSRSQMKKSSRVSNLKNKQAKFVRCSYKAVGSYRQLCLFFATLNTIQATFAVSNISIDRRNDGESGLLLDLSFSVKTPQRVN